jgi:hypothetical protein
MTVRLHTTRPASAGTHSGWTREWHEAAAVERAEAARVPTPPTRWIAAGFALGVAASLAALLPGVLPFTPGYSSRDTAAAVVAAALAAIVALAIVPLAANVANRVGGARSSGHGSVALFAVALLSTGAAAIHFAVAKDHFEEYALFGVFFVLIGAAQLLWALLVLFRPTRVVLALGLAGNLAVAALWAVDRTWGLPIGPEHWKPEHVGFADVTTTAFELVLALGCVALVGRAGRARGVRPLPSIRTGLVLLGALTAITVLGLLSATGAASSFLTPAG